MEGVVVAWWWWWWWCGLLLLGAIPLLVQAPWYFNDLLFTCSFWCFRSEKSHLAYKLPPGRMGLPFIGETLSFLYYFKFLHCPDDFINSKKLKYGGVGLYRSHLLGSPTIITCSPSTNKFVLQSSDIFHSRWLSTELMGSTSLANLQDKPHTKLKNFIVNTVNSPNALRSILPILQPCIASSLSSWAKKSSINGYNEIRKLTFETIMNIFVSMEPSPLLDELGKCFPAVLDGFRASPIDLPGTTFRHALLLNAVFRSELEKRKQKKDAIHQNCDVMDGLMGAKNDEGKLLSDQEVVDNIISVIIAAYESTATNSMWAIYYLAKSPDILQKLREENAALSKTMKQNFLSMDDISRLKYTAKVAEEAIRLGNVAPFLYRVAKRDVDYRGFRIPKGWQILVWIQSIHTDAKNFEDPLSFKSEIWDNPPKAGVSQMFGAGPRTCAGNMLARMHMTVFLRHLALNYKWELVKPDAKIKYLPQPRPEDGVVMTFDALTSSTVM